MCCIFPVPGVVGGFFFCSWILMIFWGIIGPDVGVGTLGYAKSMVATIGLWLAVAPLTWGAFNRKKS